MSTGVEDDLLNQTQKLGSQEHATDAALDAALKNLHTSLPGIIASYDPDTQVASVQPAIQRIFTEKGAVALPLCVDVPVAFPGGGDFFLTFPVAQGDECILLFSERCIDFWHVNGGVQLPADYRLHDLSDAMAIVGINSQAKKLTAVQTDGAELRTRSRSTFIRLTEGTIFIKGDIVQEGDYAQVGDMSRVGSSTTSGLITGTGGIAVSGGSGVSMNGNIIHNGTINSNGINIGSTHKHKENGTGNLSDGPQ